MDIISDIIFNQSSITPEVEAKLRKEIRQVKVKKGEILQYKGAIERFGYFVKKGLLRSYTIDAKGKEHIFMFAPEGWIIGDIEAQAMNTPAVLFIDVLEDAELDVISEQLFNDLKQNFPVAFSFNAEKLTKRVAVLQRRVIMLMSASAQERYEEFLKTYPQIAQRVPQKMIASYLGITPEALSKIRHTMAQPD